MKKIAFAALVSISALISATPSFALATLVESCTTAGGDYSVSIIDNQGTGLHRVSHLQASIVAADGTLVGSYDVVNATPVVRSASFGHTVFVDAVSKGEQFIFNGKSTNTAPSFSAILNDGSSVSEQLTCRN